MIYLFMISGSLFKSPHILSLFYLLNCEIEEGNFIYLAAINYRGQSIKVNLDNLSLDPNDASKNLRGTFRPYHL